MTFLTLVLPDLSPWLQQLAGILPLSALVEFVDVATKLHTFELNRSVPNWNWPVTPAGARLLLSRRASTPNNDACHLDQVGNSPVLHCIDGRHGDWYPSSTQATTRMCISKPKKHSFVPNPSQSLMDAEARKQQLDIISLKRLKHPPQSRGTVKNGHLARLSNRLFRWRGSQYSIAYRLTAGTGWVFWIGLILLCIMSRLYVAGVYLLLMPLTGIVVSYTHGGKPRRLLDERPSPFTRLIVAADSLNATKWLAFYGESSVLNSLLNKPLVRITTKTSLGPLKILLRLLIAGQWVLAVGSCALQDWNALVISFWIGFCAIMASYVYSPEKAARDWLQYNCNYVIECTSTEFSSRRAMLGALLYLNPESKERLTSWIDPILADSADRRAWESAFLSVKETGILSKIKNPPFFTCILISRKKALLQSRMKKINIGGNTFLREYKWVKRLKRL